MMMIGISDPPLFALYHPESNCMKKEIRIDIKLKTTTVFIAIQCSQGLTIKRNPVLCETCRKFDGRSTKVLTGSECTFVV